VPAFERFDLNGRAASAPEIARRWRDFHREVRRTSPSRVKRVMGPWLGDDTWRRRLFERLRPDAPLVALPSASPVDVFPLDYVAPSPLAPVTADAQREVLAHVAFVVASSDPDELGPALHDALESAKDWLLVVHPELDEAQRLATAGVLYAHRGDADVIFADEQGDTPARPLLKSRAVGPHPRLSYNGIGRPALLRRERVALVGGLRREAGRAGEHDLYLRLLDAGATFRHVALVLRGRDPEERRHDALALDTRRVVADALARRGVAASVTAGARTSVVTWSPTLDAWPSVDVLIPTRDRVDLLRQCIDAVEKSTYPNYTITILDNGSVDPATLAFLAASPHRVLECAGPFNYAAIINRGVAHSSADYVVTLNNDTIVRTPDWLERMVGVATLDDVSIVGATLLDRGGVHEHDAIVIAPYPQHLRRGVNYPLEDDFVVARRDVSAVTGAVQLIARALYHELGGMDEKLAVVMNDVDLCLRSQVDGRHVVMVPDVVITHYAGSTRGRWDPVADRNYFVRRWDVFGTLVDPYFPESMRLLGHTMRYRPVVPE
jgi:GT2 family glycosyltransferase